MAKRYHAIYLVIIVILSLTLWVAWTGAFTNAEKLAAGDSKSVFVTGDKGARYLTFQGQWQIVGEGTAFVTSDKYVCSEAEGFCEDAQAVLSGNYISADQVRLPILSWDDQKVVIGNYESMPNCRENIITVDVVSEDVTSVVRNAVHQVGTCALPPLTYPRKQVLMDGLEVKYPKAAKVN